MQVLEKETQTYILNHKFFYHVAPIENAECIDKLGLLLNKYSDSDYLPNAPIKLAQICFCPKEGVESQIDNMKQRSKFNQAVVYEVSAEFLVSKKIGLDYTFDGVKGLLEMSEIEQFRQTIEVFQTIACFDTIPIERLKKKSKPQNNAYFKNQIIQCAEYFESWLYTRRSKIFENNGEPLRQTFYCDLYDIFAEHHKAQKGKENEIAHNCIGCNFEEGASNIELFLKYNKETDSERYFLTLYTLLFYLQAERLGVIYKELGYTVLNKDEFNWATFPELQRIKYWANFFKHPKSYMLLHHPMFFIEGDPSIPNFMINGTIDDAFIHKFYSGGKLNEDLRSELENKDKYIIIFPNLFTFTQKLCAEFENIVKVISNDPNLIAKLATYTTIKSDLSS